MGQVIVGHAMILKTHSLVLKAVVLSLIAGLVCLTFFQITLVVQGTSLYGAIRLAIGFLAVAMGLWKLKAWARAMVVVQIWLLVILLPVGRFSPFAAGDDMRRGNEQTEWQLATSIFPWVALGIFMLHILGKYKHEFANRASIPSVVQNDRDASGGPAA